jgi:PAS domain S-box-containing protein
MLPDYIPAYSVGPGVGLVVSALLAVASLGLAVLNPGYRPLRSLALFFLSQAVFFLGFFGYGYQASPASVLRWYGVMLCGLAWMPFTWTWVASDLSGRPPRRLFWLTLAAAACFTLLLAALRHPAILGLPLEPMPSAAVWRPQSWLVRPAVHLYVMAAGLVIIYCMHFHWWRRQDRPGYVRAMTVGLVIMLATGIHDAVFAWGWPLVMGQPMMWLGAICLSMCQGLAVALRFRELNLALGRSEDKYRTILESMQEGYYEVDLAGRLVFCNSSLSRITGYPRGELIGMSHRLYMDPENAERAFQAFNTVFRTGRPLKAFDWELVRKGGDRRVIEVSVSPLPGTNGRASGFRGVARDITERKEAEEALILRGQQLRQLAAELTKAEDRERRRIARDLHDGVGQYLAVVRLRLSRLGQEAPPEHRETVDYLLELLSQAIADTRSLTAQLSPTLLYEVGLGAALEWLGEEARRRYGLEVEVAGDDEGSPLDDEIKAFLFRACSELILNVAKHAGASRAWVALECSRGRASLVVQDDGRGLDPAAVAQNRRGGLGLFSLRERAEFLGGGFAVERRAGGGTRTRLEVPFTAPAGREEVRREEHPASAGG